MHRTRRREAPSLRHALRRAVIQTGLFSGVLLGMLLGHAVLADAGSPPVERPATSYVDPVVALMAEKRCSATGFRDDTLPASALVRTPAGDVRQVSFDHGWAVHQGHLPGILVAVCRAPLG